MKTEVRTLQSMSAGEAKMPEPTMMPHTIEIAEGLALEATDIGELVRCEVERRSDV